MATLACVRCRPWVYRQTGHTLAGLTADAVMPHLLASCDLDLAWQTGGAFAAFLESFPQGDRSALEASTLTYLAAGMQAEEQAREAELAALAALHRNDSAGAQDARSRTRALHDRAARRFARAAYSARRAFPDSGEAASCPALKPPHDAAFLLGLCAASLAVLHDRAADGSAAVPIDLATGAASRSLCLADDAFAAVPGALRAAVRLRMPHPPSERAAHRAALLAAVDIAPQGSSLAAALAAQALEAVGDANAARQLAERTMAAPPAVAASRPLALLDAYGRRIIGHMADIAWTSERGHRTPFAATPLWPPPAANIDQVTDDMLKELD